MPDVTNLKTDAEFPSLIKGEELSKNLPSGISKNRPVDTSRLEGVPLQRKSAKANRSNSSCSKKPRMSLSEDSTSPTGIEESKDISDKLGLHNLKCTSPGILSSNKRSITLYLYALKFYFFSFDFLLV